MKPSAATYLLRPVWQPEKRYRWLQRLRAVATVAGLGKQTVEWRQHFHVISRPEGADAEALELGIDSVRIDIDLGGEPSRYYFDAEIPLRFQERRGAKGTLLRHTELFVRNRYLLDPEPEGSGFQLTVVPLEIEGEASRGVGDLPQEKLPGESAWERVPWETLYAAILHQGLPAEPLAEGARWRHKEELMIPLHGEALWDLEFTFSGFKEYEDRVLALVEFAGEFHATFHQEAAVAGSPGLGVELPKVRGLTLVDVENRWIASTVVKMDGKLRSLGLPGTAEGETAPLKKTLTLTLLGVAP